MLILFSTGGEFIEWGNLVELEYKGFFEYKGPLLRSASPHLGFLPGDGLKTQNHWYRMQTKMFPEQRCWSHYAGIRRRAVRQQ